MDTDARDLELLDCQRRADRLGIPFTPATPLEELQALVAARESDMGKNSYELVNGQWQINGELPLGLVFVDGKFVASNGATQPECFGELWDGTPGGSAECRGCVFSPVCMEMMAQITFTAAQAALGPDASLAALAAHCDVSEQAVLIFLARKKGEGGASPAKKKKKPPVDAAPAPVVGVGPAGGSDKATATVLPMPPAPEAVQVAAPAPTPEPAPTAQPAEPAAPAPEEPAALKSKAKRKAKASKAEKSAPQNPRKARPVKRAKAGARARKAKNARPAKARVGAPLGEKWGEHTWLKRWERERARCPEIRRAVPGSIVTVERGGQTYQAKVVKGYYELSNGQKCPTLCEAAKLLTGNANWSAVRFWGLSKATSKPPKALQAAVT